MIIVNSLESKHYNEEILNPLTGLRWGYATKGMFICPCCKNDRFHRKGSYDRYLIAPEDLNDFMSGKKTGLAARMKILRVQCTECNSTHAVLPSDVVPYHSASVQTVLFLLLYVCSATRCQDFPDQAGRFFSWHYLNCLVTAYRLYKDRMTGVLYSMTADAGALSDADILKRYRDKDIRRLFLKREKVPLFVVRKSTCRYPLRYTMGCPT